MATNKKPKKPYKPKFASKQEMLGYMKLTNTAKTAFNEADTELLVEKAKETLDNMKKNPDQNGLIDMADITNVLCDMIFLTDRVHKRKKYYNSPDIQYHLWSSGFGAVAKTINAMHMALYEVEKRVREFNSFAISSSVMVLFEKIVEMYKSALEVAPKGLVRIALTDSRHSHKVDKNLFRIAHFELAQEYYINEEVWNEYAVEH